MNPLFQLYTLKLSYYTYTTNIAILSLIKPLVPLLQFIVMEVSTQRQKSELSSNDSENLMIQSVRLGKGKRGSTQTLSSSCDRLRTSSNSELLSSISRKLKPNNIEVLCKRTPTRMSDFLQDKGVFTVSCFPQLPPPPPILQPKIPQINDSQLKNVSCRLQRVIENIHPAIGQKRGCLQQNCPVKRKWLRKIAFYQRELKNVRLLRERAQSCSIAAGQQIDKDVTRTYPSNILIKTKLLVSQSSLVSDKFNLIDILRIVLKLYAVFDRQVGYVQGMNLVCGAIVMHMRQVNSSFVYFKEIMLYGKLREFYQQGFFLVKQQLQKMLHRQLKYLDTRLYSHLLQCGIESSMFLQYYLTLFASVIQIQYMHIIIDLFMRDGVLFLHRLCLTVLIYLRQQLMIQGQQDSVVIKLGASYIKELKISWENIIMNSFKIDLL